MHWRRLNNAIHRDLGYFFVGTTIAYAISGLLVNHVDDWNPNFTIERREVRLPPPGERAALTQAWIDEALQALGEQDHYRGHDFPSPRKVKIYLEEGSVLADLRTGEGIHESVRRRPVLAQLNRLHLAPRRAWLVFSDVFAVALVVVGITGLLMLKGPNGLTRRGLLFVAAGLLVPVYFLLTL